MSSVTINGHTYTDDANPTTGLAGGGHRTRFVPLCADVVVVADQVTQDAAQVAEDKASVEQAAVISDNLKKAAWGY